MATRVRNCNWTHLQLHTCHSSHVHVNGAHKKCCGVQWCDITSEFQFHVWRSTGLKHESAHVIQWTISTKLFALDVTSEELHREGYAGVRLGEAQNPKPAEHEKDNAQEEPSPRRTRINEVGDAVPGSRFHHARSPKPTARRRTGVPAVRAPPTMPNSQRTYLSNNGLVINERFCNVLSATRTRSHTPEHTDSGLTGHMESKVMGASHTRKCGPAPTA